MTDKPTYEELEHRVKELGKESVERKRIEKRLEEKEQTLKALLNAPPETAILVDLDGTVLAINEVGAQRFGKKIDELIGKGMHDRMPYDLAVSRKAQGDKVARSGRPVRYQDERAGRIYDNNIYPVFDTEGKVVALAIYARDITETKRAEEALRESEERYRSIIHKIQAAIVVHDADTRITACNSKSLELLGLTEDQMLGKTAMDSEWKFLNADGESMSLKEYPVNQVLATQQPLRDLIVGIYRPNKVEQVWVLINADPVFDYKENIQQVIVTFMDITELKKAEEEINQQRTFLNLTIESLPHPFYVINTSDYTIKLANSATGLGDLSKEATTCYTLTHNKDRPCEAPEHICPLEKIKKTRKPVTVEHIHHDQEGKPKNVEVHAYPIFDSEGNVSQIILSLFDITERKQAEEALKESEEKFRLLYERAPLAYQSLDKNGHFLEVNQAWLDTLEYTREEVIGKSFGDFVHPGWADHFKENFPRFKTIGEVLGVEFEMIKKDGSKILVSFNGKIGKDNKGNFKQTHCIFYDITKQKRAEEALREKEQQLFQAQKMESLGTLVSGVAHEINNPINLIMFNVPLLQNIWQDFQPIMEKQEKKEPGQKYGGLKYSYLKEKLNLLLSDMDMASNRIANIVSNLKNFARQTDITDKRPMQINEAVENAIKLSQTTLRKSDVALELGLGHDLPLLEGNRQAIEQIVLNLIVNAIQAIEHSHGQINIITEFQKEKNQIIVSISDNGKGIDPSISEKVFDPFITDKQAEGGTGLGLSVTYNLVSAHSGHISFKSEKGKGTTFTVCIPTRQDEIAARILLVDDEKQIRDMLKQTLAKRKSLLVEDADNGIEACIKLGSLRPDLLILDINMPEMDGLEVCRTIRKDPNLSSVKVMIMTGYPNDPRVKQVAELGFTHIYTKPLKVADFLKEIDNILLQPTRVMI